MNSNSSTTSSDVSSGQASADSVSRRAYEIWEQEGKPEGNDLKHWLQAERELSSGGEASSTSSTSSKAPSATSSSQSTTAAKPAAKNTGTDTRPLQGTRAAGAANRDAKKGSTSPFERVPSGSGGATAGTKRR